MIYFALNNDGLLYNLGDHGDWEAAEDTAQSYAGFIGDQLTTTESTQ